MNKKTDKELDKRWDAMLSVMSQIGKPKEKFYQTAWFFYLMNLVGIAIGIFLIFKFIV